MNWKVFESKYDKKEEWAFEKMSYQLFCAEFNNRIGLFRYKNQTGIETEPIEKDGIFYGFQAKYYSGSISSNKEDIIDSIEKAKSKNNALNVLYLYVNQELSESSNKHKKASKYREDIEKAATSLGLTLEWRVPSHIELQLSLPENKYIYDTFFTLESNEWDLLDGILKHNANILQSIQTEISYGDSQIKIERTTIIEELTKACEEKTNVIISGEGGCGKTAIFKEFYNLNCVKFPICVFKANELNLVHINDLFHFDHKFTFTNFIEIFRSDPIKIFVIDSAEKLAEITNVDVLVRIIQVLKDNGWNIIFTTRYSYLNDLSFHIKENYQIPYIVRDIPTLSLDELKSISHNYNFTLPDNNNFVERLRNLFYLSEYLQSYSIIDRNGDFRSFVDLLWKKKVRNDLIQTNNIHIERENCLIGIVKKRCETGAFYINIENMSHVALFQLKQDEILGYDDAHRGYFITHDIYEEWALEKIVSSGFANYTTIAQFYIDLGNSLPIRRAFRLWLSDRLSDSNDEIEGFIKDSFLNNEIIQFWKDELLTSALLSDFSVSFFNFFEAQIISNDFAVLKRILFLLRIACTDISVVEDVEKIRPKGKGWEVTITFIYKHRTSFFDINLKPILPILTDWCNFRQKGTTTRYAGLLALSIIQKKEFEKDTYISEKLEERILRVVFNAAREIQVELQEIFDKTLTNKWTGDNDPYEGLCTRILDKPYLALEVIQIFPSSVIKLCDLFWQKRERVRDIFNYDESSMENMYELLRPSYVDGYDEEDSPESLYGLASEDRREYFPPSAHQTPIFWLLQISFRETLDFIIDFLNRCIESYKQSDNRYDVIEEISLQVEDGDVKQYLSDSIWCMYRGSGSPAVPYLLQSIHMALEKILLDFSRQLKAGFVEHILQYILKKSTSTSLTAIVCSIILANPDKFYRVAKTLFKTIEFFHTDTIRCTLENEAKSIYSIGYGMNKTKNVLYNDERLQTCTHHHRSLNLESLLLNYQFFGIKGLSEEENTTFREELYRIIDNHKSTLSANPNYEKKHWDILLARMDRRNLTPRVAKQDENSTLIEFEVSGLSEEYKKQSEQAQLELKETYKYSGLRTWSDFLNGQGNQNSNQKLKEYDENPLQALAETKQLLDELKSGRNSFMSILEYSIPAFSCSKLILEYSDKLSKENKDFCKEVILSTLSSLFIDKYYYQISDGVEACIRALPSLFVEYPDEIEDYLAIMIMALFDNTDMGTKRICDYVLESIHESKLWKKNPKHAQSILFGYIKLKPFYDDIIEEIRKDWSKWGRNLKALISEQFDRKGINFTFESISFKIEDIDLFDVRNFEILCQLIPTNTSDGIYLDIYTKSCHLIAQRLLKKGGLEEDNDDSLVPLYIFRRVSQFLLHIEIDHIDIFLQPFLDSISPTKETATFINELISAEDKLNHYEQFWYIWNELYSKMKILCDNPRNLDLQPVITNYLLAGSPWREDIEEWHSLKSDRLSLYVNASNELGHIPCVLYSIAKILNLIGTKFSNDGINWICTIVSKNPSLQLGDLETNTLIYLEKFVRKFVYSNKIKIKQEIRLKYKVIPILDFMIERGSIHGYLLRESIL